MTNANTPAGENKETQKSENIVSKIFGGMSWWVGSLMGKPSHKKVLDQVKNQQPAQPNTASPTVPANGKKITIKQEDSVMQDVQSLKNLVGKFSGKVATTVAPVVKSGAGETVKAAGAFNKKGGPKFMTNILRVFFVLIFVIILVFVAVRLMRTSNEEGTVTEVTPAPNEATPTPIVYHPPKASVYAEDPEILKLEEDINVITREISSTVLREMELTPPTLDFNIIFK